MFLKKRRYVTPVTYLRFSFDKTKTHHENVMCFCYGGMFSEAYLRRLNGAGDEARTRYLHLGKVTLYQMSYTRILPVRVMRIVIYIILTHPKKVNTFFIIFSYFFGAEFSAPKREEITELFRYRPRKVWPFERA